MPSQSRQQQKEAQRQPELPSIPPDDNCNARKRKGDGYCNRPAGWGTDHSGIGRCKLHGGNMPNHRKNAQLEIAKAGVDAFALPINIEPHQALIDELQRTAGIIAFYEAQIRDLNDTTELTGPVGTAGEAIDTGLEHHPNVQPNVWVRLHREERAHLVKVAETCIKAGIEERRIKLAEEYGAIIANYTRSLLRDLGVNLNAPKTRRVIRARLLEISQIGQQPQQPEVIEAEVSNGDTSNG